MALQLPAWAQDKKLQLAAGAGVLLGAVTYLRKKSAKASTASSGGTTGSSLGVPATLGGGGASGGYGGTYDSSGTDAYNNLQTSLDNQLQTFAGQITSLQDQLANLSPSGNSQSGGGSQTPSTPGPSPAPAPAPMPAPSSSPGQPAYYRPMAGDNWNTIAARYYPSFSTAEALNRLRQLNGGTLPAVHVGQGVRVR